MSKCKKRVVRREATLLNALTRSSQQQKKLLKTFGEVRHVGERFGLESTQRMAVV